MTHARLVRVICPSCEGSGKSPSLDWTCHWCIGLGRVPVATALQWADHVENIAVGGYFDGGHDLADKRRMEADAAAVRKLIADYNGEGMGHDAKTS